MRAKYIIVFTLIAILLTTVSCVNASAMTTGFEIESIPTEKAKNIFDRIYLRYENDEAHGHSIKCFDISDSGLIAVGFDEGNDKYINIYNSDGQFQYGYSFKGSGTYGMRPPKILCKSE